MAKKKRKKIEYEYLMYFKNNNIFIEKFPITEKWIKKKRNKIEKLNKQKIAPIELTWLTKEEIKEINESNKKITERDIDNLLLFIYSALSWKQDISSIKNDIFTVQKYLPKKEKLNPIILILLKLWYWPLEILKKVEFQNKTEILEILSKWNLTADQKRQKMKDINKFSSKLKELKSKIIWEFIKAWAYLVVVTWLIFWLKFVLFPLFQQKLSDFWLDASKALWPSMHLVDLYFKFLIVLWIIWIIFLLIYLVSRDTFWKIIYKIIWLWKVYTLWNTLKWLILFSFYKADSVALRNKIYDEIIKKYFKIKRNENYSEISEIYFWYLQDVNKKYWVLLFDPRKILILDKLKLSTDKDNEEIIRDLIESIMEEIDQNLLIFSGIVWIVSKIMIAIALIIVALAISLISISAMNNVHI